VLPLGVRILHATGAWIHLRALWSLSACIVFLLWMCLAFGVFFQLPLVMGVLSALGLVSSARYARARRYAIFVIVAAAAVITPTVDAVTMILVSVPLVLLYEAGIVIARGLERRARGAAA